MYGHLHGWVIAGAKVMAVGTRGDLTYIYEITFDLGYLGFMSLAVPPSEKLGIDDVSTEASYKLSIKGNLVEFEEEA